MTHICMFICRFVKVAAGSVIIYPYGIAQIIRSLIAISTRYARCFTNGAGARPPSKLFTVGGGNTRYCYRAIREVGFFRLRCAHVTGIAYKTIRNFPYGITSNGRKVALLNAFSVNRVSIGVQSFMIKELHTPHRRQCRQRAPCAGVAKRRSFSITSLLIFTAFRQTHASFRRIVTSGAFRLSTEELFLYPLCICLAEKYVCHAVLARDTQRGLYPNVHAPFRLIQRHPPRRKAADLKISLMSARRQKLSWQLHYCSPVVEPADITKIIQAFIDSPDKPSLITGYPLPDGRNAALSLKIYFLQDFS